MFIEKYPVNIAIGLTNHAKFVDKSLSVLNYIKRLKITIKKETLSS